MSTPTCTTPLFSPEEFPLLSALRSYVEGRWVNGEGDTALYAIEHEGRVAYVGITSKGITARFLEHVQAAAKGAHHSSGFSVWLKELVKGGNRPQIVEVLRGSRDHILAVERAVVAWGMSVGRLLNSAQGGILLPGERDTYAGLKGWLDLGVHEVRLKEIAWRMRPQGLLWTMIVEDAAGVMHYQKLPFDKPRWVERNIGRITSMLSVLAGKPISWAQAQRFEYSSPRAGVPVQIRVWDDENCNHAGVPYRMWEIIGRGLQPMPSHTDASPG